MRKISPRLTLACALALVAAGATASPAAAERGGHKKPTTTTTTLITTTTTTAVPPAECSNGYVSVSYDDSPTSMTPTLLSALASAGMRSTFFDVGERAAALPAHVRSQVAAGHEIGNHSYSHPDLTLLSAAQVTDQLSRTQTVLAPLAGYAPKVMRPPYGAINDTVRTVNAQLGLFDVIWTVDTVDWNNMTTAKIVTSALTVQPGGFILMHDGYANTIAAVPQIAAGLKAKGLCPGRIVYSATGTNAWEGLDFPTTVAPW